MPGVKQAAPWELTASSMNTHTKTNFSLRIHYHSFFLKHRTRYTDAKKKKKREHPRKTFILKKKKITTGNKKAKCHWEDKRKLGERSGYLDD